MISLSADKDRVVGATNENPSGRGGGGGGSCVWASRSFLWSLLFLSLLL